MRTYVQIEHDENIIPREHLAAILEESSPHLDATLAGRRMVTPEEASAEKGYPHPGSFIALPNGGGTIYLQFGHIPEVGRNGCFTSDVLQGLIENLATYQVPGHPMRTKSTDQAIHHLKLALEAIEARKESRRVRAVHETDKP